MREWSLIAASTASAVSWFFPSNRWLRIGAVFVVLTVLVVQSFVAHLAPRKLMDAAPAACVAAYRDGLTAMHAASGAFIATAFVCAACLAALAVRPPVPVSLDEDLRRDDLDIGSGAVEGAVRNLVGMRLDGPGMRWGRDRAEMILHLRCIVLNGQWDAFCHHLEARPLKLAAQPVPARTHDAKPQQSLQAAWREMGSAP